MKLMWFWQKLMTTGGLWIKSDQTTHTVPMKQTIKMGKLLIVLIKHFKFPASTILLKPFFLPPSILFFLSLHLILLLSFILSFPSLSFPHLPLPLLLPLFNLSVSFHPFIFVLIASLLSLSLPFFIHSSFNLSPSLSVSCLNCLLFTLPPARSWWPCPPLFDL